MWLGATCSQPRVHRQLVSATQEREESGSRPRMTPRNLEERDEEFCLRGKNVRNWNWKNSRWLEWGNIDFKVLKWEDSSPRGGFSRSRRMKSLELWLPCTHVRRRKEVRTSTTHTPLEQPFLECFQFPFKSLSEPSQVLFTHYCHPQKRASMDGSQRRLWLADSNSPTRIDCKTAKRKRQILQPV